MPLTSPRKSAVKRTIVDFGDGGNGSGAGSGSGGSNDDDSDDDDVSHGKELSDESDGSNDDSDNDEDKKPSANENKSKSENDLYIDHILNNDDQDIVIDVDDEPVFDDNGEEYAEGSSGDEDEDNTEGEEKQRCLPPAKDTKFWNDRNTNDNNLYAQLIKRWYGADSKNSSSHFQGVRNRKSLEVSDEVFLFAQGTIPQVFFSLFGEDGFDIRNLTQDQLDELKNELPNGWVLTVQNDEEDEDDNGDKV